MEWSMLSVWGDVARANAQRFAGKTALVSPAGSVGFDKLNHRINRLNNALTRLGLAKGDRVAILSRNRAEFFEGYGVAKSGLVAVPLNWRLAPGELLHPIRDSEPAAILAEPEFAPVIDRLRPELHGVRHFAVFGEARDGWLAYEALLESASGEEPRAAVEPEDIACLMYTSGTTGKPKGAALTHRALLGNCRAAIENVLELDCDDVTLSVMPMFHVGGMWYHLFPSFACGCTTAMLPDFEPRAVLAALEERRATNVELVPTMIQRLLAMRELRDYDLSRLRTIHYAASTIPVALLTRAIAAFDRCGFVQGYGSTEAGMITALTPDDHRRAAGDPRQAELLATCGRPLPGVEVRIIGMHGEECPDGKVGEVQVRSSLTMACYWRNAGATKASRDGGWLATGDLGRRDDSGFLTIVDRKHDMIVSGGENIYPSEVENALYQDPEVLEAAVFGLPDPQWVEKVAAAVVLRPGSGATADDIVGRARSRLAAYKCPKTVIFAQSLPKNAAGKVLRKALRQRYGAAASETCAQ